MFDKDISNMSKPEIKGRGFVGTGNDIIETQTYYTEPDKDWIFDEDMLVTYNNPEFKKLCKRFNKNYDELNTGWVKQVPLDQLDEDDSDKSEDEEEEKELNEFESKSKDSSKDEEDDDEWDWDDDEEEEEENSKSDDSKPSLDISMDDLAKMFADDSKDNVTDEPNMPELPTRDKVYDALNDAPVEKPKIKLTFDPTTKPKTNKIKFNRPPSDFTPDGG